MTKSKTIAALAAAVVVLGSAGLIALEEVKAPLPEVFQEEPVRILFVGDLMLDRNVARSAVAVGARGLFATSTLNLFANADLRVLNLEGTVTTNPSLAQRDNKILRFTFEPDLTRAVLDLLNTSAVSLANNHALDFGEFGYDDTEAYLDQWGVAHFGQPYNDAGELSTTITARGKTFCFVGYHALFAPNTSTVIEEITRLRPECYRVIVFTHWGEEYELAQNDAQRGQGRAFIDAGADLVIGAHPHVVQPYEIYRGKAIFYSLGNFMFDQNFSWATQRGLAVRVDFYQDKTTFTLTPLTIREQYSEASNEADAARVFRDMGGVAEFSLPW